MEMMNAFVWYISTHFVHIVCFADGCQRSVVEKEYDLALAR